MQKENGKSGRNLIRISSAYSRCIDVYRDFFSPSPVTKSQDEVIGFKMYSMMIMEHPILFGFIVFCLFCSLLCRVHYEFCSPRSTALISDFPAPGQRPSTMRELLIYVLGKRMDRVNFHVLYRGNAMEIARHTNHPAHARNAKEIKSRPDGLLTV